MSTVTLLTAFAALTALALRMNTHRRASLVSPRWQGVPREMLVVIGWLLVAVALGGAVRGYGWAVGAVLWVAALAVAGFGVTLLLTYRPRVLPVAAGVSLIGAVLIALWCGK
jgi:Protein of unknown function (DUF3325)